MQLTTVGLDLGQQQDPTALAVLESRATAYQQTVTALEPELHLPYDRQATVYGPPFTHAARHLERVPLGTSYPEVVQRVQTLARSLRGDWLLAVDATGVGRPVVDMFVQAGLAPVAITITGGDTAHGTGSEWRVPKRDLVGVVQVGLQQKRLQIARALPLASTLVQELLAFKVKITAAANDTYGAWREGAHDDLVLAVAIAAWTAEQVLLSVCTPDDTLVAFDPVRISPF